MLRKFIEKINKFIQWTKKWHFCHFLFVGIFVLVFPYIFFFIKALISEIIIFRQKTLIFVLNEASREYPQDNNKASIV